MINFDFNIGEDIATFYYSADGVEFDEIGEELQMLYTLDVFVGYRIGVFSYPTKELGGYTDFRNLSYAADDGEE